MNNLLILGTSSDSGKSTLTFAIAKILQDTGLKVAPFKAQNVSNNAEVCEDGGEIGVAQYFQGEVLGLKPTFHFNPVLLKIEGKGRSQVVVEGKVRETLSPREYYQKIEELKPYVKSSFEYLSENYDVVVAEGAGSPVEMNLLEKDLANTFIAREFSPKIILVADIEKGGVFASIYGTLNLLKEDIRKNVIGVVINKFRGDISLFEEGIKIIEEQFNVPILGVVPYTPLNLGFEDSQSLFNYKQSKKRTKIKVGVIAYPKMSNYNDIEPLIGDTEISVEFIKENQNLKNYDLVILPGTKSTVEDLRWLKETGLFKNIKENRIRLYGICGGYQMMFERIVDRECVETEKPTVEKGLGFIDGDIVFQKEKVLNRGEYGAFKTKVKGFEIHNGVSEKYPLFFSSKRVKGSFLHGVFDNDAFRKKIFKPLHKEYQGYNFKKYKKRKIEGFVKVIKKSIDVAKVVDGLR